MASETQAEHSEDVSDFLRRIKELGDKRDSEDEERRRKLEEDILESRRQREARRAERARSLSPEKRTPGGSPSLLQSQPNASNLHPGEQSTERLAFASTPLLEKAPFLPAMNFESITSTHTQEVPAKQAVKTSMINTENSTTPSKRSPSDSVARSRAGTMSWQQRPTSLRGPRSRPVSVVDGTLPSSSVSIPSTTQPANGEALSRDQISQNLGSKDPSWFRQISDKGSKSQAYRQYREDETDNNESRISRRALHGLSRENSPALQGDESEASFISGHSQQQSDNSRPSSMASSAQPARSKETLPLSTYGLAEDAFASSTTITNPKTEDVERSEIVPSRPRYERPDSPTKGLGGFVQSAMLKRSDSISKRWSAQAAPGLTRHDSNTETRSKGSILPSSSSMPKIGVVGHESSRELAFRPESSQSNAPTATHEFPSTGGTDLQSPPSPSKRWSPTKSSWLESALNKPEVQPIKPTLSSAQPSWMAGLAKAKLQRASREENKATPSAHVPTEDLDHKPIGISNTIKVNSTRAVAAVKEDALSSNTTEPEPGPLDSSSSFVPKEDMALSDRTENTQRMESRTTENMASRTVERPKPITPPKVDFRSSLKPREALVEQKKKEELEFKNVVGNLKRTKTVNYVAPDELKNNILRGKAGLSLTDGPQKTQRRDELKEDLLKQKEAMKVRASEPNAKASPPRRPSSSVTPEAIAKKKILGKNTSAGNVMNSSGQSKLEGTPQGSTEMSKNEGPRPRLPIDDQNLKSSNISDRFNPGLASLLARGPPLVGPQGKASAQAAALVTPPKASSKADGEPEDGTAAQLQHMTKARARGPKRRLPKADTSATFKPEIVSRQAVPRPIPPVKSQKITPLSNGVVSATAPAVQAAASVADFDTRVHQPAPQLRSNGNAFPAFSTATPTARLISFKPSPPSIPLKPSKPSSLRSISSDLASPNISPLDTVQLGPAAESGAIAQGNRISVRNVTTLWGRTPNQENLSGTKAPITLPAYKDTLPDSDMYEHGAAISRVNVSEIKSAPKAEKQTSKLPATSADKSAHSKPIISDISRTWGRTLQSNNEVSDEMAKSPAIAAKTKSHAPMPQESEAGKLFANFFDEPPSMPQALDINTNTILASTANHMTKIKTLRKQMSEVSNDGKTTPVASGQEHVLYNDRIYVCSHVFSDENGARMAEVYLWAGSTIHDGALEDSQLFANEFAKDVGGKLIVLRQGKETSNFFQALGGIVITRSASTRDGSKPYMLCGREHLGHLAFDEVTYSMTSLSSGFSYIVAASPEKVFLWKGAGCSTEEISGARLISMDVFSSARVTELDEGRESPGFFGAFPSQLKAVPKSADHWKQKPNHKNYKTRLFNVDWHERSVSTHNSGSVNALWGLVRRQSQPILRQLQISEISPFVQRDLETENVYVLDAFFEIYILLGPRAQRKSRAFASALIFAQEYAILAASAENRPFVPFCSVVLEGAPRDMKMVFRQWDDANVPTELLMTGKPKRAGSLKVLPLSAAIAATKDK